MLQSVCFVLLLFLFLRPGSAERWRIKGEGRNFTHIKRSVFEFTRTGTKTGGRRGVGKEGGGKEGKGVGRREGWRMEGGRNGGKKQEFRKN